MENKKTIKKSDDSFLYGFIFIISILIALPFFIATFFARLILKALVDMKTKRRRHWIIFSIIISIYSILGLTLFLIGDKSGFPILDYFFPFTSEVKLIIMMTNKDFSVGHIGSLMISIYPSILIILVILYLFRGSSISSFKSKLKIYKKAMDEERYVTNPSKPNTVQSIIYVLLFIDIKYLTGTKLTDQQYKNLKSKSIMLNREIGIPIKSLDTHVSIIGSTGSGKSETMYKFTDEAMKMKDPVIEIDGKGSNETIKRVWLAAQKYNRNFKLFTLNGKPVTLEFIYNEDKNKYMDYSSKWVSENFPKEKRNEVTKKLNAGKVVDGWKKEKVKLKSSIYNPFSHKESGLIVDGIMALFNYTEEHYESGARVYLEILISSLIELEIPISWTTIINNLDQDKLIDLIKRRYNVITGGVSEDNGKPVKNKKANHFGYNIDKKQILNVDERSVSGFISRIGTYYNTTKESITDKGFTIEGEIENDTVLLFSLNSLSYPLAAGAIGRLISNDIKSKADNNQAMNKNTLVLFDEFNVFANTNMADLLSKVRSKGYRVILAFQSPADLAEVSNNFKEQIIENTNTKLIHKTNEPNGAEYLGSIMGTIKTSKMTYATEEEETTGKESIRVVENFIAHPNLLKELKPGHCFIKYTDLKGKVVIPPAAIKVNRENTIDSLFKEFKTKENKN